jgi:ArsR family transcriptional regulator
MSNNEKDIDQFAHMFKALSNPNRLKIFQRLVSCCSPGTKWEMEPQEVSCVGDISKELEIVPSTVSHHIKELRLAGLIKMKRNGQKIECWIDPESFEKLKGFFD